MQARPDGPRQSPCHEPERKEVVLDRLDAYLNADGAQYNDRTHSLHRITVGQDTVHAMLSRRLRTAAAHAW